MTGFTELTSRAVPLDAANVDTDAIIPKQFLQKTARTGFGKHLFHDWRFLDGDPGRPDPAFVLNDPIYFGAEILLARANFGCGSSREHAPWALADYGFRAVIAPSFADIFYNNAFNSGLLPVRLKEEEIDALFAQARENPNAPLTVDLTSQTVRTEKGAIYRFEIDAFRRNCLMKGLDAIDLTLQAEADIARFEETRPDFL